MKKSDFRLMFKCTGASAAAASFTVMEPHGVSGSLSLSGFSPEMASLFTVGGQYHLSMEGVNGKQEASERPGMGRTHTSGVDAYGVPGASKGGIPDSGEQMGRGPVARPGEPATTAQTVSGAGQPGVVEGKAGYLPVNANDSSTPQPGTTGIQPTDEDDDDNEDGA